MKKTLIIVAALLLSGCKTVGWISIEPVFDKTNAQELNPSLGIKCDGRNAEEFRAVSGSGKDIVVDSNCSIYIDLNASSKNGIREIKLYANDVLIYQDDGDLGNSYQKTVNALENTYYRSGRVRFVASMRTSSGNMTTSPLTVRFDPSVGNRPLNRSGEAGHYKADGGDRGPVVIFPNSTSMYLSFFLKNYSSPGDYWNPTPGAMKKVHVCVRSVESSVRYPSLSFDAEVEDDRWWSADNCVSQTNGWRNIPFSLDRRPDGFPQRANTYSVSTNHINQKDLPPYPVGHVRAYIIGLPPNAFIEYRIVQEINGKYQRVANRVATRTPPQQGGKSFYFSSISDLRSQPGWDGGVGQERVRDLLRGFITSGMTDLVILPGDISNRKGFAQNYYDEYFSVYRDLMNHVPFYPIHGNHDLLANMGYDFFTMIDLPQNEAAEGLFHRNPTTRAIDLSGYRSFYSFDWGDTHFVALDVPDIGAIGNQYGPVDASYEDLAPGSPETPESMAAPPSEQIKWLRSDLADASNKKWRIVYFHNFLTNEATKNKPEYKKLIETLKDFKVHLVIAGHDECPKLYPELAKDSVSALPFIINPSGGAHWKEHSETFNPNATEVQRRIKYGLNVVRVSDEAIYVTTFDVDGGRVAEMKISQLQNGSTSGRPIAKVLTPIPVATCEAQ